MSDIAHLIDSVPFDVLDICRRLREHGNRGWIVGGCVRDLLRGEPAKDWDVATDARPEAVLRMFRKVIPTGLQHGTVTVVLRGTHYEVTTLRGEGAYSDGRRPDTVEFVEDIVADLARRDFTVNAIALDPVDGHLIDPFDGRRDLAARIVRAVGDPRERFAEDGLRVLRAARFAATLEHQIDPDTERAMGDQRSLATFRRVSQERVRDEWLKSMRARRPSVAFEIMRRTGILGITCPELLETVGCQQNKDHAYDVWTHTMSCLDACEPMPLLRIAALLHDIAKPRTHVFSEEIHDVAFPDHDQLGARMVIDILSRLRFSNDERDHIAALVRHHLAVYRDDFSDAGVRRFLHLVGPSLLDDLFALARADILGKGRDPTSDLAAIAKLRDRATKLLDAGVVLGPKDLAIRGNDLLRELSIPPGPLVGELLAALVDAVIDDPSINERSTLLALAKRMNEERHKVASVRR